MPDSQMKLRMGETSIEGELYLPGSQLKLALPQVSKYSDDLLSKYILEHFKVIDQKGEKCKVEIIDIEQEIQNDSLLASYIEYVIFFKIIPNSISNAKFLSLAYDGIVHKVGNHSIFVFLNKKKEDNSVTIEESSLIGIIKTDIPTNSVLPLKVDFSNKRNHNNFIEFFSHGVSHIKNGTDHLLFLILLIFGAFMTVYRKKWEVNRKSIKVILYELLKIVSAFTVGHSITLFLGSMEISFISPVMIESLVCISIFITAVHIIRPLHSTFHIYLLAGIFGLVHGFAFSEILVDVNMLFSQKILAVLGFNLGIEYFQIIVVIILSPLLSLISRNQPVFYLTLVKVVAFFAMMFSLLLLYSIYNPENTTILIWLDYITDFSWVFLGCIVLITIISIVLRCIQIK